MKTERPDARKNETNIKARTAAHAAIEGQLVQPTGKIAYQSKGRVAIISGRADDYEYFSRFGEPLKPVLITPEEIEETGVPVIPVAGRSIQIEGYLGNFDIEIGEHGEPGYMSVQADLILDLSPNPVLSMTVKPPGYIVAKLGEDELSSAQHELEHMVGSFEKPRYFEYDASICAHGRSGQSGCNRCLDTCPAEAITGLAETVEVNPYLCQGGGVCASVCPSGAIRYNYPNVADMLNRVRTLLRVYYENAGQHAVIGFVSEADAGSLEVIPDNLLIIVIEELASVGMEVWLSAFAYGAKKVLLIDGGSLPVVVYSALREQIAITKEILSGMGYVPEAIDIISVNELPRDCQPVLPQFDRAMFAGLTDKRQAAFLAIDYLYSNAPGPVPVIALPNGSSFGTINVNNQTCTLCMSCTSVCPAGAVQTGNESPQLIFHESNCLQCGICASACPENAISLEPRLLADPELRQPSRVLHEQPAFCCVVCGKPFATNSVIQKILSRLDEHAMFQEERARRRLMMCEDCRVIDVVQDQAAMELVNRPPSN